MQFTKCIKCDGPLGTFSLAAIQKGGMLLIPFARKGVKPEDSPTLAEQENLLEASVPLCSRCVLQWCDSYVSEFSAHKEKHVASLDPTKVKELNAEVPDIREILAAMLALSQMLNKPPTDEDTTLAE